MAPKRKPSDAESVPKKKKVVLKLTEKIEVLDKLNCGIC